MKKRGLGFAAAAIAAILMFTGCSMDSGQEKGGAASTAASSVEGTESGQKEEAASEESKGESAENNTGGGVNPSDYVIGYSQLANTGTYRIAETNSMKEEAQKRGYQLIVTDAQDNTAKQVSDVEDLIAQNIDVLILSPREFEGLETALQTAKEHEVPVILVDRLAKGEAGVDYITYIATDFVWEGRAAGEWLRDKTGGTCNIIELTGTVGASSAQDRAKGFAEVVAENPEMKVLASQTGNFERSEGQKVMENLLQAHGDEIDVVFCHNDQMALGAVQAIKAAGYKPNEDILVVGVDGEMDAFKSVIAGEMSATVVSSPMYGPITFDTVEKVLAGEELPTETIMEGAVVDSSNAEENMHLAY
ncbi:ABC transporter substrate-binding protein [Lachnospiraceae bacterium 62-35]